MRAPRTGVTSMIPVSRKPEDRSALFGGAGLGPPGVLCCVLFCVLAALILDYGALPPPFAPSTVSPIDFFARVAFHYSDPDELNRLRLEAAQRAPRVYVEENDWVETIVRDLERIEALVEKSATSGQLRDSVTAEKLSHDYGMLADEMFRSRNAGLLRVTSSIRDTLKLQFARSAILAEDDYKIEVNKPEPRRIVRIKLAGGKESATAYVDAKDYLRLADALESVKKASWRESADWNLSRAISSYLDSKFKPSVKLDAARSKRFEAEHIKEVGSGEVQVAEGDAILERNQIVRAPALVKLRHEFNAYKSGLPWLERVKHLAGLLALAGAVLAIFLIVATRIQPGLWKRRRALVMLGIFCLGTLALSRALLFSGRTLAYAPMIILGMSAALAFGQAVALLALSGVALLSTFSGISWEAIPLDGGQAFFSLALLAGAVAAAIPAERLNDRWDLLKYGMLGGVLQGSVALGISLLVSSPDPLSAQWPQSGLPTLTDALVLYANGPLCGLLVLGSLPLIESLFGIITNIRLFELADLNQPALRRLQLEAPGTFAHTLQVRFLAEPAAEAIGAHTRLVSAGVLYHDLGKTLKPEYFVENTFEAEERHKRLKPSVSALLIISHVKDGIDMAREYKLPSQIVDFIPEHHGTTLVSYFYHSAVKEAAKETLAGEEASATEVQEAFFRYPGPKPQTRETAIVMLADTVEAASRTLNNPSATRLRQFVHELMMDKLLDNQLDDCNLTFAELALVEEAFLRVLATRFHSRIRYPGQEEEEEAAEAKFEERLERAEDALQAAAGGGR